MALGSTDGFMPMWFYSLSQEGENWFITCHDPRSSCTKKYLTSYTKHFHKFIETLESKRCLGLDEIMYEYTRVHFTT